MGTFFATQSLHAYAWWPMEWRIRSKSPTMWRNSFLLIQSKCANIQTICSGKLQTHLSGSKSDWILGVETWIDVGVHRNKRWSPKMSLYLACSFAWKKERKEFPQREMWQETEAHEKPRKEGSWNYPVSWVIFVRRSFFCYWRWDSYKEATQKVTLVTILKWTTPDVPGE